MPKWEIACKGIRHTVNGVCSEGKIPTLIRDNYEIWHLFILMLPGLMRSEGYDYNAIQVVFDIYEIEQSRRGGMFASINKLIDIISDERRTRAESNK